jgi:hypothetical protein
MSKPKRIEDFTFKEYFSDPQRKEQKEFVISILASEGFNEEQLNEMNMKRVWSLSLRAVEEVFERELTNFKDIITKNPEMADFANVGLQSMTAFLKKQIEELEQKLEEEKKGS